jgi:hypothetical protein
LLLHELHARGALKAEGGRRLLPLEVCVTRAAGCCCMGGVHAELH